MRTMNTYLQDFLNQEASGSSFTGLACVMAPVTLQSGLYQWADFINSLGQTFIVLQPQSWSSTGKVTSVNMITSNAGSTEMIARTIDADSNTISCSVASFANNLNAFGVYPFQATTDNVGEKSAFVGIGAQAIDTFPTCQPMGHANALAIILIVLGVLLAVALLAALVMYIVHKRRTTKSYQSF